jgi:hypothetical protein
MNGMEVSVGGGHAASGRRHQLLPVIVVSFAAKQRRIC